MFRLILKAFFLFSLSGCISFPKQGFEPFEEKVYGPAGCYQIGLERFRDSFLKKNELVEFPLNHSERHVYNRAFNKMGLNTKCTEKATEYKLTIYHHHNTQVFSLKGLWSAITKLTAFIIPYRSEGSLVIEMTSPTQQKVVIPMVEWQSLALLFSDRTSPEVYNIGVYSNLEMITVKTIAKMISEHKQQNRE